MCPDDAARKAAAAQIVEGVAQQRLADAPIEETGIDIERVDFAVVTGWPRRATRPKLVMPTMP